MKRPQSANLRGGLLALIAAIAFGATTPIVALAGRNVGALLTASLLYAGASLSALGQRAPSGAGAARLRRAQVVRLGVVSFFGAAVAPTLLAWGLQRTGGMTGSLLLNLEAVFTALLARAIYREPIGRRVGLALCLMVIAGGLLAADAASGAASWSAAGALAVSGATLAWALDNILTRPLSEEAPLAVVAVKGALGALLTGGAGLVMREALPSPTRALVLLACGATGYGLSLELYLLAQRAVGAARTGSIFAVAPFVGAALGWALGFRAAGPLAAVSAVLFGVAVTLHLTERHRHRHRHQAIDHAHAHRHDDGHHDHRHELPVSGEHAHPHRHHDVEHDHEHAPDLHHRHDHPPPSRDSGG